MAETIRARFDVLEWNESEAAADGRDGPATSAVVEKRYRAGLIGRSSAAVLMVRNESGAAYTAIEGFHGTLGERSGGMSFVHGGIHSEEGDVPFGYVVPGSGTGGFAGVAGTLSFGHDAEGAYVDLELVLPPGG